ncbi:MAG: hypothetical protein IKJ36_03560 [Clostridia bacterium]|nr:hypothetical protein [Clostridia bacterium]
MGNNGIEDILIGQNYKKEKKKGRGVVVFIILLLLCALGALVYIYYRLTHNQVSTKELFLKTGAKIDYVNTTNVKLIDNLMENLVKKNSETETKINFSTTIDNEELKDIDVSKFVIEINGNNDAVNKKSFNEMIFNYSGNKVYGLKMLFDENKAALYADEITDKYVALNYDSMPSVLGIDLQKSDVTNFLENNKVQLTQDEFKIAVAKYANLFTQYLADTSFTIQENLVIPKNSNQVNVTGYEMNLTQDELKASLLHVLTELKSDDNLLNKFITGKSQANVIQTQNEIILNPIVNQEPQVEQTPDESQDVTTDILQGGTQIDADPVGEVVNPEEPVEGEQPQEEPVEGEQPQEEPVEGEQLQEEPVEAPVETPVEDTTVQNPTVTVEPVVEQVEEKNEPKEYGEFLLSILSGKKVEMTLEETKALIDEIIDFVKNSTGDGIKVILYASEDKVEKIAITLPNTNTIDIEFLLTSVQETNVKVTYLYKGNDSGLDFLFKKDDEPVYQDGVVTITEAENVDQINGYSLEVVKTNRDANLTIKGTLSFIENEKINEKIIVDIVTEGTSNSILVKNNLVLTHSTSEGETIATFDNKVRFSVDPIVDSLNQENSIFLDEMDEEQRRLTVDDIKLKLENIKEVKKDNLKFIDTNTNSSTINTNIFDQVTSLTRDDARNLIVNRVSQMMTDAVNNNQEFTIQNLQGLSIDGYVVGVSLTDTEATIVIGMYTFKIDTNFNLTDVE